jgi:hypothetical protein
MAKFYTNSTGTKAIRLSEIRSLSIQSTNPDEYVLVITMEPQSLHSISFEIGSTMGQVQQLAAPLLVALEE